MYLCCLAEFGARCGQEKTVKGMALGMENKMKIKITLAPGAEKPVYATPGSAGADLRANISAPLSIPPGGRALIPTGVSMLLPSPEYAGFLFARSGLAVKKGLALSNGVGVIDSDYTGEIKVGVINQSREAVEISPGDRIAQLVLAPVCRAEFEEVLKLDETLRGSGGFGSTGTE